MATEDLGRQTRRPRADLTSRQVRSSPMGSGADVRSRPSRSPAQARALKPRDRTGQTWVWRRYSEWSREKTQVNRGPGIDTPQRGVIAYRLHHGEGCRLRRAPSAIAGTRAQAPSSPCSLSRRESSQQADPTEGSPRPPTPARKGNVMRTPSARSGMFSRLSLSASRKHLPLCRRARGGLFPCGAAGNERWDSVGMACGGLRDLAAPKGRERR